MRFSVKLRRNASRWRSTAARRSAGPATVLPSYNCPEASTRVPPSLVRHLPVASKFSSASPSGSITRWHEVHAGFDDALPSAPVPSASVPRSRRGCRRMAGRWRRRWRRRAEQHFHHPLPAHHWRRAIGDRRQHQHAAMTEKTASIVGHRDPSKLVARPRWQCRNDARSARSRTCSRPSADRRRCGLRARCCRRTIPSRGAARARASDRRKEI